MYNTIEETASWAWKNGFSLDTVEHFLPQLFEDIASGKVW